MKKKNLLFTLLLLSFIMVSAQTEKENLKTSHKEDFDSREISSKPDKTDNPGPKKDIQTGKDISLDKREIQNTYKGVFDIPEIEVKSSPDAPASINLGTTDKVIDYDISPAGLTVAALISDTGNKYSLRFWNIGENRFFDDFKFNDSLKVKAIAWHPQANSIFVIASGKMNNMILRLDREGTDWKPVMIYSSKHQLKRLVICPRPFITSYDNKLRQDLYSYRLFFGIQKDDGSYRIASVTEFGKRFYQVIGPASTFTSGEDEDSGPSTMESEWALPLAFHPSGDQLIWNDSQGRFFVAHYSSRSWGTFKPLLKGTLNRGSITPTPNGSGLIHWQKEMSGIGLIQLTGNAEEQVLTDYWFSATPSSVPDGKGIVGLIKYNSCYSLNYFPLNMPQSDVINAWMFSNTREDIDLFTKNSGLFRVTTNDQLYQLYESENYYCNNYDQSTPTRPYLVTTDIFWELFGSAFQGIFTIKERSQAIPAFWNFVTLADAYFKKSETSSPWAPVFNVLGCIKRKEVQNPESKRILNCESKIYSDVLRKEFDYSQLKPRGFYTSSALMQEYFKAFKYLTTVFEDDKKTTEQLNFLPPEIRKSALEWIESYKGFISPPRKPNVFNAISTSIPEYVQYPDTGLSVFPLSWGFDNEALNSVVYHSAYPKKQQIISNEGDWRLQPSGLDLAAAISSDFAWKLLEEEYQKYPNLRNVISSLRKNFNTKGAIRSDNLYDRWITALSTQWADTIHSTSGASAENLWQVKRLQTGLASWATLRHATVLVNETGAAECGEGGFEAILTRAPRGYVEADPGTFGEIADLFEASIDQVPGITKSGTDFENSNGSGYKSLYEGITKRLHETANKIRMFQRIAEKEKRGEAISNDEYEEILYTGRVAEHYFLIFKSMANEEYALSNPDPILKITNVFGNRETDYLMAAVGNPYEWDLTVPFYGRHQVVKGSVYSYFEFVTDKLLNDKEWINISKSQGAPSWVKPYVSDRQLSYPPQSGY